MVNSGEMETSGDLVPAFPRAGCIKEVKVKHFMCHKELTVTFGTQVSFVTGHNGSGKSAVLAAVVAGLGARATVTNRGAKLEELIEKGENRAVITIRLHNAGDQKPLPFQPKTYGHTVIVERTLNRGKAHSYKLMDCRGKLVSQKASDLAIILEHFEIQVGNPVFLMNQDTSRTFLNSQSERDFYKSFYQAPMLDEMEAVVQQTKEDTQRAKELLDQKNKEMEPVVESIEEWEEKQKKAMNPESIRADLAALELEIEIKKFQELRAQTRAAHKARKRAEEERDNVELRITSEKKKLPNLQVKLDDLRKKADETEKSMTDSRDIIETNKPLLMEMKKTTAVAMARLKAHQTDTKQKRKNLEDFQARLDSAKNQDDLNEMEQRRVDLEAKIADSKLQLETAKYERQSAETAKKALDLEKADIEKASNNAAMQHGAALRNLKDIETRIAKLEENANNNSVMGRLGRIPADQKRIIDGLVRKKALKGGIVGPGACYLGIKDEKFGVVVEKALGYWFKFYFIENEQDRGTIIDEFKAAKVTPPSIDCLGRTFMDADYDFNADVNQFVQAIIRCQSDHKTVYDYVTFSNPHVRNVLVEATAIHQCPVLPSMEEARAFYRNGPAVRNCRQVFDMEANVHSKDQDGYMFMPNGGLRNFAPVLYQTNDNQIVALRGEFAEQQSAVSAKKLLLEQATITKTNKQRELNAIIAKHTKAVNDERRLENLLGDLKIDLQTASVEQTTDIQVLMEEIAELETAVDLAKTTEQELKAEYDLAKGKETKADGRYEAMRKQLMDDLNEQEKYTTDMADIESAITKAEEEIARSQRKLTQQASLVEQRLASATQAAANVQVAEQALTDKGVKEADLDKKIQTDEYYDRMRDRLTEALRNCSVAVEDSWEHCQQKLEELRQKQETVSEQIGKAHIGVVSMQKNADIRQANYYKSREKATEVVKTCFSCLLEERGFKGEVLIDHEERKLRFEVIPIGGKEVAGSSVKSLSGGERSYTMVCFLVSLWMLVETPFRILDEFDVFMDMLNREHAMIRLIHSAVESGRQYIFLTPLHLANLSLMTSSQVRMWKLSRCPLRPAEQPLGHRNAGESEED